MYEHEILPGRICRRRKYRTEAEERERFRIVGWIPGPINRYVETTRVGDGAQFWFLPEEILPGELKP